MIRCLKNLILLFYPLATKLLNAEHHNYHHPHLNRCRQFFLLLIVFESVWKIPRKILPFYTRKSNHPPNLIPSAIPLIISVLIDSYFSNKTARIRIDLALAHHFSNEAGVPQRSILRLYILDISAKKRNLSNLCSIFLRLNIVRKLGREYKTWQY